MLPSEAPLHVILNPPDTVGLEIPEVKSAGSVKVMVLLVVQPLASVTVTSYVPAVMPDKSSVLAPFDQI